MEKLFPFLAIIIIFLTANPSNLGAQNEQSKFDMGGFIALNVITYDFKDDEKKSALSAQGWHDKTPAFSQTNLNLYFMYNSQKNWIAFSEIMFTYGLSDDKYNYDHFADGYVTSEPQTYTYTDEMLRTYDLGGIFIERAYIEYNQFEFARVRFGRFLTPYGIFSQDHGAPAVISVRPPMLVMPYSTNGMPQNQTGLELLGNKYISDFGIEYAAYVSNGPSEDPNANGDNVMCRGGFLNLIIPTLADMIDIEFGGSVFQGKRTYTLANYIDTGSFTADESQDIYTSEQRDLILAAHCKIAVNDMPLQGTLLLQAEYLKDKITDRKVLDRNYLVIFGEYLNKPAMDYDYTVMYVQAEYQMYGWITPYFRYEQDKTSSDKAPYNNDTTLQMDAYFIGINIKPIPNVSLKFEAAYVTPELANNMRADTNLYNFQVSMAFL